MITYLVRRLTPLVALAFVVGACVQRVRVDDPGSDMWFHLRLGHEFLAGWSIRDPGHLGVFDSADWTPTQWLPQIAMAATEDRFGVAGVAWLAAALHIVLVLSVYAVCRREAAPLPAAIATVLAFLALTVGLSARPQVLSYLLLLVTVAAWLATERDGRPRWWLVALAWVWAPLHGMWPLATIVGVVCVAGMAADRSHPPAVLRRLALVPVLSAVLPALTPLGLDLYRSVLVVGGRGEYFVEWGPTDFHRPHAIVLLVMLTIVTVHVARTRRSWMFIGLLLLAGGWAVYSLRTTPVAAAIAAPLVATALQSLVPDEVRPFRGERPAVLGIALVGLVVLAAVVGPRADVRAVPSWTDDRLAALPEGSRVLDDWANGPYFLWRHPGLDLVMHGYGDVFTDEEIRRNKDIVLLEPGWRELVDDLKTDAAIVEVDTPLGYALTHDDRWTVVEQDDTFAFLEPR